MHPRPSLRRHRDGWRRAERAGSDPRPSPHSRDAQAPAQAGGPGADVSLSSPCSGPHSREGTAAGTRLVSRPRVEGDRDRTGEDRYRAGAGGAERPRPDPGSGPSSPRLCPSHLQPGASADPSSSPRPSPQRMGHGEAPLQADALVHQELPEEPGGAARGVPGRAGPRCRGRRGGALHRRDSVEAGRSVGRGTFSGRPRGRGPRRGDRGRTAPPHHWSVPGRSHPGKWGH